MTDSFAHLHVHTEYSMLDGAAKIKDLVAAVAEQGMPAVAITDHGNMFGAYEFWKAARDVGVNPIIGIEAYVTPGTHRSDRSKVRWGDGGGDDVSGGGAYTHMTMLAETTEGMHNLFRLSTFSSLEGQYFKPRMDRELLSRYSKGIIATTGCPSGEVQTRLRLGQYDEARKAAADFRDMFGAENYFAELMDHGIGIERRVRDDLLRLAKDLNLPLLATNDLHYTRAEDAAAQDALLAVQSGSLIHEEGRFKFDGEEYYLKSPAQMRSIFSDFPEASDNTLQIAERAHVDFNTGVSYLPQFPVPEGYNDQSWLIEEVERGLQRRYPNGVTAEQRERADFETGVICQMGFASYYLVVADFIRWARENGVRVGPGRGSGAGSLAAYAMGITDIDPLQHGLIFERFLNPDRVSMPDFDVDFDDRGRGEVLKYVTQKYGDDRVAQIVTYGSIKSKQAFKDAARVLGFPYGVGEKLTKAMPPSTMGNEAELDAIFNKKHPRYKETAELRELIESDSDARKVYETAVGLENLKRQTGVHPAGLILSSEPLIDIIPLMKREDDGQVLTQFEYSMCEELGLVKMDFLGLRNLTILEDTLENIRHNTGDEIVLEDLPLDDVETYRMIARGDTLGVFQLDSPPMRSLLRLMQLDSFDDITAVLALYRPGPMGADSHTNYALRKIGQQPVTSIHPELAEPLAEILNATYGLIIYQEQVMSIARKVAGFTLGQADILRRAMGKKKKSELDKQKADFFAGMEANGYSDDAKNTLWDLLLPFSDYAFNKSHAAAYGIISYWTAYLKAHYPVEFLAALLTSVGTDRDKLATYLSEARRMGVQVLPPDVNESGLRFHSVGTHIRFGIGAVKGVGEAVVRAITETRAEKGAFTSFADYMNKVPLSALGKRTLETLIKAGAFDSFGHSRRALLEIHENAVDSVASKKRAEQVGDIGFDFDSLFETEGETTSLTIPDRPEWPKKTKLAFEREVLGLYVSDHPLAGLESALARLGGSTISGIKQDETLQDNDTVTYAGLVTSAESRVARNSGNAYMRFTVEDFSGDIEAMLLGKSYEEFSSIVVPDSIVVVRGRVSRRDDGLSVRAFSVTVADVSQSDDDAPLNLIMDEQRATPQLLQELQAILQRHVGSAEVRLTLRTTTSTRTFRLPTNVKTDTDLFGELKSLLGPDCLV